MNVNGKRQTFFEGRRQSRTCGAVRVRTGSADSDVRGGEVNAAGVYAPAQRDESTQDKS